MKEVCKITLPASFNLEQTVNCGQCFRFVSPEPDLFCSVILGSYTELHLNKNELSVLSDGQLSKEEILNFLDLDEDYDYINGILEADSTLKSAIEYAGGIRILRQPRWETLCSFILSQNNNIKRISGIIERLCENFGDDLGGGHFSFPSADVLSKLEAEDLAPIRSGFRAKYVIDAARKVACGEVDLKKIDALDTDSARLELMRISGVGPKVADCTLLFGFHKLDAFPKDVWIKKVLEKYYPQGFPEFAKAYGGIAQQYLFHYIRTFEEQNKD